MKMQRSFSGGETLPTYAIDTFGLPGKEAREIWKSVVEGTFELEGGAAGQSGHRVRTQVWFLEDLMLAVFKGEANVVNRTQALIDRRPSRAVKVRIYRSGHSLLIDGDTRTSIGPGAIHFIDHDRPVRQVSSDHEQTTVSLSYSTIGYDPLIHPAVFSIGLDTPHGRIIEAGLSSLFSGIGTVTQDEAPALSAAVVGLLRGALAGCVHLHGGESFRQARIAAFKRFIDKNLADPDLGLASLLREFGTSRATVYRDFAEEGGLQHYVLNRRLQRAYRLLAEASPLRGHVQDVASRCGFASLSHFSRRFRAAFGVPPSDVIGLWRRLDDAPDGEDPHGRAVGSATPATVAALHWAYERFI